jgi:hypothetical protein
MGLEGVVLFCMMTGEYDDLAALMADVRSRFAPLPGAVPDPIWRRAAIRCELARTPRADREQIEHLLGWAQTGGDRAEAAFCLWTLAYSLCAAGDYAGAVAIFGQSMTIYQEIGDPFYAARVMCDVGLFSAVIGQFPQAYMLLKQAGETAYALGDVVGAAQARIRAGLLVFLPPPGR